MRNEKLLRMLALGIGALALVGLILNLTDVNAAIPLYVAGSGLALALAIAMPFPIGAFMRFFIVFYGVGYIALIATFLITPLLPIAISGYLPPPLTAFTAAAFGLLAIAMARVPVLSGIFTVADPYFETNDRRTLNLWFFGRVSLPERWLAYVLLGIIILINLGQVGISVTLSYWGRDWIDSIQNKNAPEFWRLLLSGLDAAGLRC